MRTPSTRHAVLVEISAVAMQSKAKQSKAKQSKAAARLHRTHSTINSSSALHRMVYAVARR